MSLVSIVIPCHNQAKYVAATVASAEAQRQDTDVEILVIDDGSTDASGAIARSAGDVQVLQQPNRGLAAARNRGLEVARGECVVFLDSDDLLLPGALAANLAVLARRPEAPLAAGRCRLADENGRPLATTYPPPSPGTYAALLSSNPIWTPGAALFRRAAVLNAGGFPVHYPASADYALYLRLARAAPLALHEREVLLYRQHPASMSRDPVLMLRSTLAVLDAERPCVSPSEEDAFLQGVRAWKMFYGDQIANALRAAYHDPAAASSTWLTLAAVLARMHPAGFTVHAWRKLTNSIRRYFGGEAPVQGG